MIPQFLPDCKRGSVNFYWKYTKNIRSAAMPQYTIQEYANLLTRTYAPRFPRDDRPRTVTDVTDKGEEILEFILPNPVEGRFSVSLQVRTYKEFVSECSLFFGQAEVAGRLEPEEAISAMDVVLGDGIVAIVRYKNREAYDNHRKAGSGRAEWLFQMPDDEEELEEMLTKLKKPATLMEKISGKMTGVFEVYRWSGSEVLER
jgi:hypothetical protein